MPDKGPEYHGVPYKDYCGDPCFRLKHQRLSEQKFGTWEYGAEFFDLNMDGCGCDECRWRKKEARKRVPHLYFYCPYCSKPTAWTEPRAEMQRKNHKSIICRACTRHLWIRFLGWKDEYWDAALKEKDS